MNFARLALGALTFSLVISTGCIGPEPEGDPTEWQLLVERIEVAAESSLPEYGADAAATDANFYAATGGQTARTSDSAPQIVQAVRSGWNAPSLTSVAGQIRGELLVRDAADLALASEITKLGAFVAAMTVAQSLSAMDPAVVEGLGIQNFWTRVAETNTAGLAAQEEVERFLDDCEGPGASFEAGIIDGKKSDASFIQGLVYAAGDLAADVLAAAEEKDVPTEVVVHGWDYLARLIVDQRLDAPDYLKSDELSIKLGEVVSLALGSGLTNPASLVSDQQVFSYKAHLVTVSSEAMTKLIQTLRARHQAAMNSIRNLRG